MGDIASNYSGASRAGVKKSSIRKGGQFSRAEKRKGFGLLRVEKQIIALTVEGCPCEETARSLGITQPALALHLTSIYDKLHVSNQFELILFALYHQLIDSETAS